MVDKYNDFGVKLTNRAGTIKEGQEKLILQKNVTTPYQFLIIGTETYFCPQDWQRRVSMGNMSKKQQIFGQEKYYLNLKNLLQGKRCNNPCTKCNAVELCLEKIMLKNELIYKI